MRRWEDPDDQEDRLIWTGPSIASDRVIVVGSNEEALSLSPYNGGVLGTLKLRSSTTIAPVFANKTMYIYDESGDLLAYR